MYACMHAFMYTYYTYMCIISLSLSLSHTHTHTHTHTKIVWAYICAGFLLPSEEGHHEPELNI